jgi:hypothetical protein
MLISQLFANNADLELIAAGGRRMFAPEVSNSVALVQIALVAIGFPLKAAGIDDSFGQETGVAVVNFKTDRGLFPNDPVVGPGTIRRLDLEMAWLEGGGFAGVLDPNALDTKTLALDPVQVGFIENQFGDFSLGQRVLDTFELGDRICFRPSLLFDLFTARAFGQFIERRIFDESFCVLNGPCTGDDFLDEAGPLNYTAFLKGHNPAVPPARIDELANERRPDIISHRDPKQWYEIKPHSISGVIAARIKLNVIPPLYAARGLPYLPGTAYDPVDLVLAKFITPEGEKLDLILNLERPTRGLVFYALCVKGDYVTYFNRVRIAVGVAALLAALIEFAPIAAEAGEVAAALAALRELLAALGVAFEALPRLVPRPL